MFWNRLVPFPSSYNYLLNSILYILYSMSLNSNLTLLTLFLVESILLCNQLKLMEKMNGK